MFADVLAVQPEEINRIVTDSITDWFFVTEPSGVENLRREGHPDERVFHVGHVMVDNVLYQADQLERASTSALETSAIKLRLGRYGVVTLHRPSNVDDAAKLTGIAGALRSVAAELPLVFPVHPRTRAHLEQLELDLGPNVHLMAPQAYMSFLNLWKDATLVITDSGGLQEESTALGVPCITVRENTERPVTVDEGTNTLAGTDPTQIVAIALDVTRGTTSKEGRRPALWDGRASFRIVDTLANLLGNR